MDVPSRTGRPLYQRERIAGAILLLGLVYIAFEFTAAAAWVDPPYDWARNLISDLGFSDCATVDGDRICSPLHPLMNAGFMVQGVVFTVGSILVVRFMLPERWMRWLVAGLMVVSGVGTFLVGIFHQSLALFDAGLNWLHVTSAILAIGPGNLGILLLGVLVIPQAEWRGYGIALVILGMVGTVSAILLLAKIDFGLGLGLIERIAVYPLNAWTIGSAVGLLVKSRGDHRRWLRARVLGDDAARTPVR